MFARLCLLSPRHCVYLPHALFSSAWCISSLACLPSPFYLSEDGHAQHPSLFLHCLILALTSMDSLKCVSLHPFSTTLPKICDLITSLLLFFWAVVEVFWYNLTFSMSCFPIRSLVLNGRDNPPIGKCGKCCHGWGLSWHLVGKDLEWHVL